MQSMSKRKINEKQRQRIETNRSKLLDTPEHTGLVVAHYGTSLDVEDESGNLIVCSKRQHLGVIVPGDSVIWQMDLENNTGVVLKVLPRRTLLSRPNTRGDMHAVAANIDQMFIVFAPTPPPSQTTIDRYLIAAETEGIKPILVMNKEDLLPNDPHQPELLEFLQQYKNLGVPCLVVSAKERQHISLLDQFLAGKISVFVGQSGVGKSSIISILLPELDIKIGDLSILGEHGKHTTTSARLYHLKQQHGIIIDSPGIREFPLWAMEPAALAYGFIEFRPFLGECKFRNCLHTKEPGCALLNAANTGKIAAARLLSYQKILSGMQDKT